MGKGDQSGLRLYPQGREQPFDLGTLQALPGRGLARAGDLHVLEEKGHRRREPGAVIDLPVALLEADELARSGEIVTIGVQFVEQIDQVIGRRRSAAPKIGLHIIVRLELAGNLGGIKLRDPVLARQETSSDQRIGVVLLGPDVHGLVHRRGEAELNILTRQKSRNCCLSRMAR
jgi:hypothetical protein